MSEKKRYVLEMTAEELLAYAAQCEAVAPLAEQMRAAVAQAKADRDADDLHLPWHVSRIENTLYGPIFRFWVGERYTEFKSERQAKLMAAAPELLEAVQAAREFTKRWDLSVLGRGTSQYTNGHADWDANIEKLLERALRKAATGQPEPL